MKLCVIICILCCTVFVCTAATVSIIRQDVDAMQAERKSPATLPEIEAYKKDLLERALVIRQRIVDQDMPTLEEWDVYIQDIKDGHAKNYLRGRRTVR